MYLCPLKPLAFAHLLWRPQDTHAGLWGPCPAPSSLSQGSCGPRHPRRPPPLSQLWGPGRGGGILSTPWEVGDVVVDTVATQGDLLRTSPALASLFMQSILNCAQNSRADFLWSPHPAFKDLCQIHAWPRNRRGTGRRGEQSAHGVAHSAVGNLRSGRTAGLDGGACMQKALSEPVTSP